jgi:Peptidase M15
VPIAIILIAIGGLMVASALSDQSIADVFANFTGVPTDKRGGDVEKGSGPFSGVGGEPPAGTLPLDPNNPLPPATLGGKGAGYKGPNAAILESLHKVATGRFHLSLTNLCRSAAHNAAVGGSRTSFHLQCRAGDYDGTVANRVAFARYAKSALSGVPGGEVFCDQAGMVAPGFDHSTHVHIGA